MPIDSFCIFLANLYHYVESKVKYPVVFPFSGNLLLFSVIVNFILVNKGNQSELILNKLCYVRIKYKLCFKKEINLCFLKDSVIFY
jgi:hypothetical protein